MHPNGSISIMDRSKDIIISGGEVRCYYFLRRVNSAYLSMISKRMRRL